MAASLLLLLVGAGVEAGPTCCQTLIVTHPQYGETTFTAASIDRFGRLIDPEGWPPRWGVCACDLITVA